MNLPYDFFRYFIELWTLVLSDKTSRDPNISSSNTNIQSSIKWWKRILQQVLRDRCKEKISIFKTMVDLIVIFQYF